MKVNAEEPLLGTETVAWSRMTWQHQDLRGVFPVFAKHATKLLQCCSTVANYRMTGYRLL